MKPKLNCVLVIDDDEPTNFFTRMILEESGCTRHIKIVQSGREALEYLSNCIQSGSYEKDYPCPDLVLLDINMPAMNGWEFLEEYTKLNKEYHRAGIITVMLTTSLFPEDMTRAKEMPEIAGFENKPITTEKLEKIVQKYFVNGNAPGKLLSGDELRSGQAAA